MDDYITSNKDAPGSSNPFKSKGHLGSTLAIPSAAEEDDGVATQDGFDLGCATVGEDGWEGCCWDGHLFGSLMDLI